MEHGLDLDHAVVGVAPVDVAALFVVAWRCVLVMRLHAGRCAVGVPEGER
jgi:hypothetical protein